MHTFAALMEIGKINKLKIVRETDLGCYLADDTNKEVLLQNSKAKEDLNIGDDLDVFVYKQSEDQIVATRKKPYILFEEFAYLKVKKVNEYGAFLDWGLSTDLLVPFKEQTAKMVEENWYLIFLFTDERTGRLIGSNKINDFVFFDKIDLKTGDEVDLLLYNLTDLGVNTIVNNKYKGLIFQSDIHKNIHPGDKIKGYVRQVREDGKIDIALEPIGYKDSIDKNSNIILSSLKENDGFLELNDKSSPDDIKYALGLSKKAFKKSIGNLYKQKIIELYKDGIKLL